MALLHARFVGLFCFLYTQAMVVRMWVNWRWKTCFLQTVPNFAFGTWLASQVIRIPQGLVFMAHTHVTWFGIFFTVRSHIIKNCPERTWLAQIGSGVPKWIFLITVDLNALVHLKAEGKLLRTSLISLDAFCVILVPFFSRRTGLNALLVLVWPFKTSRTCFTLAGFLIERGSCRWALKALKVGSVPIRSGRRAHWSGASLFASFSQIVKELVRGTSNVLTFRRTLLCVLIKSFVFVAYSAKLLNRIVVRFFVAALVAWEWHFVPERSFRWAQWMGVVALGYTFSARRIKIVAFTACLGWWSANSCIFIPSLVWVAFSAAFGHWVKEWCLGRARLAGKAEWVPEWSSGRTGAFISVRDGSGAFPQSLIKILPIRTVSIVATDMRGQIQNKSLIFAILSTILLTVSRSDIKQRLISGTCKASIILNLNPGLSKGTRLQLGIVILLLGLEQFSLVVGLGGIAPVPTWSVEIVSVCVLDHLAALWVYCVFHNCLVAFHHWDFVVQLLY